MTDAGGQEPKAGLLSRAADRLGPWGLVVLGSVALLVAAGVVSNLLAHGSGSTVPATAETGLTCTFELQYPGFGSAVERVENLSDWQGRQSWQEVSCQNLRLHLLATGAAPVILFGAPPVFVANVTRGPYVEDPLCTEVVNHVTWTVWAGADGTDTLTAGRLCTGLTGRAAP